MKLRCDGKIVYFLGAENLCGATVTLVDLLGLKDIVLDTHYRESTMVAVKIYLIVFCTIWWSLFIRGLRLLL